MRTYTLAFFASLALVLASAAPAAAQVDLGLYGLIGTGFDTGDANNNPYALQLGGAAELTVFGWVLGVRATRAFGTDTHCTSGCFDVDDLRSIGGDFGWDWEVAMLHISPRVGVGGLRERDGDRKAVYLEPGGVAEVELGMFAGGIDIRYRVAVDEPDLNGLLGFLRLGLRI